METNKNIGLIECSSVGEISGITSQNNPDRYVVKKIMTPNKLTGETAALKYPEAQLVDNINSIIDDSAIELILVSNPKQGDLNMVGEVVQSGKNVRII